MSEATLRREGAGVDAPASFLSNAIANAITAVLDDAGDRPIELAPGVWVRAQFLVGAVAPETIERARALYAPALTPERCEAPEPQSIRADVVARVGQYTGRTA